MRGKMNKGIYGVLLLATAVCTSCGAGMASGGGTEEYEDYDTLTQVPAARDGRGDWPVGWIYATLEMVETDRMIENDRVSTSPNYLLYNYLLHPGESEKELRSEVLKDLSGTPMLCLNLLERFGMVIYNSFRPRPAMTWEEFRRTADADNLQLVCDTGFAYRPEYTVAYGVVYTPEEYGLSLYTEGSYEGYVCDEGRPYGECATTFEESDGAAYVNVPIDSLMGLMEATLGAKRPLVLLYDTVRDRRASLSAASLRTTDCVLLRGKAVGQDSGEKVYVCRSSGGEGKEGDLMLTEEFVRRRVLAVYRHRME